MMTLEQIINIKVEEQANDEAVWRWSHTVVEKLGKDGMSSDKSHDTSRHGYDSRNTSTTTPHHCDAPNIQTDHNALKMRRTRLETQTRV